VNLFHPRWLKMGKPLLSATPLTCHPERSRGTMSLPYSCLADFAGLATGKAAAIIEVEKGGPLRGESWGQQRVRCQGTGLSPVSQPSTTPSKTGRHPERTQVREGSRAHNVKAGVHPFQATSSVNACNLAFFCPPHWVPFWDGVYCLVPGTPPPPFVCKILKTQDLFCDYVLDL
jgi:hypothetical protein